jgi:hypothetical protein
VGPDASQGPDGIQDLHFHIAGLAAAVAQLDIQGPAGFEWATAPDPTGAALAEYFPASSPGQGDLYINPRVKSDVPSPGSALTLGGSTGSLIQLADGMALTLTFNYSGQTNPDAATVDVSNLASAMLPMPAVGTPANVVGTFRVTDDGQDGSGGPNERGFVHLVATAPPSVAFGSATFSQVLWQVSDGAGIAWDSTAASLGHNHTYATLRPNTNNIVDLYFPPQRDEAPAAGSTAPNMLLQVSIPNDSSVYATPFVGGDWNKSLLTTPLDSQAPPGPAPTTESQLDRDLSSTSPEYDTIDLPANTIIVVTQPIKITHSVRLVGNNATLLFQQGNTAAWPATASGAIYVDAPTYDNIQLELDNLTIRFDMSSPIRWSTPSGTTPALYDPADNPTGIQHAVIDTGDSNVNSNITSLTLNHVQILGPPAFDGASFASIRAQLAQQGHTAYQYVGEQDMNLVRTNFGDCGTISNSTLQGGTIEVCGGPWTITGNTITGSTADTYSPGAFAVQTPHDVVLEGNQVTQSDPTGREFRLVNFAGSGFDDTIENNSFTGGQSGGDLSYSTATAQFIGINDPEVILAESSYGVLFEGRPSAISADGRLVVLSMVRGYALPVVSGPGMVVSILAGVNSDGTPNLNDVGQWFRVAQQVSISSDNTIEFLMEDRLPAMPAGGYYVIEVTGGFVNNSIVNNTINLSGKSSTGVVFNGEDYGTRIVGNHFIGGSIYQTVYTGTAISLTAVDYSVPSGNGLFPLPPGWTTLPDLGAVIENNTIQDALGGIVIGVDHGINFQTGQIETAAETGRVFLTAAVIDNTFEFDSSFLNSWANAYVADGNNPAQSSTPPTITIGSGFSAAAPGPYGNPRFPWTVGNTTPAGSDAVPIFVDPMENMVTVQSNPVELITPGGNVTSESGLSGQVYAAFVNGVTVAPTIAPQTYNGGPYYPFNLHNLDISAPPPAPQPPPPPSPSAPQAPTGVSAVLAGPNLINLFWNASAGASAYIVARAQLGTAWSEVATNLLTTSFSDIGLAYATTYYYCVLAVSSAGRSPISAIVGVQTLAQSDVLSGQSLVIDPTRRASFTGAVATFTDANTAAAAGQFIATINWANGKTSVGTVSGGDGVFTVTGTHTFMAAGIYPVKVTVAMDLPGVSGVVVTSTAKVSLPSRIRPTARARPAPRTMRRTLPAATKRAR